MSFSHSVAYQVEYTVRGPWSEGRVKKLFETALVWTGRHDRIIQLAFGV